MRVRDSKRLVIDADVARASGSETATHPRAERCRDFLNAVLSLSHRIVMTEKINNEWKNHQSRFARRWRVSMDARKKIDRINPLEDENLCCEYREHGGKHPSKNTRSYRKRPIQLKTLKIRVIRDNPRFRQLPSPI